MKRSVPFVRRAASPVDVLACCLALAVVIATVLPALARAGGSSQVQQSLANLTMLGVAHHLYAADWNGRQVSISDDALSTFGPNAVVAFLQYAQAQGGCGDDCLHPPAILGWGMLQGSGNIVEFKFTNLGGFSANHTFSQPLVFPGAQGIESFGGFRLPNRRALHDYVGGRFYDETFYAPGDVAYPFAELGFDEPWEYADIAPTIPTFGDVPYWSSYAWSPAAMFHPDVMRSEQAGGWQDPWLLDNAFETPGQFQAMYPDLKTQMIEFHWNQNAPKDPCNPNLGPGSYDGCEPYSFNQGLASEPAALFFDLSTRLLPNTEVQAADAQVMDATGEGLWNRSTPYGNDGYLGEFSFDEVNVSHHMLTTDGILGRDTTSPSSAAMQPTRGSRRGGGS